MKQVLVLSGKGGTGKTTLASSLISLLKTDMYADCDVEAPNLHITVKPSGKAIKSEYCGLPKAEINPDLCVNCMKCYEACRFGAVSLDKDKRNPVIQGLMCEGCGVCGYVCPENAITMKPAKNGETILYKEKELFSTAKLQMGAGASGKLVSQVKKNLHENIQKGREKDDEAIVVIDGSPGIGCPVIASLSGVDLVLIVTEPTLSGKSDMIRILDTAIHFRVKVAVCINKYDICKEVTEELKLYCAKREIPVLGEIPYDKMASIAINEGRALVEYDTASADAIRLICRKTVERL